MLSLPALVAALVAALLVALREHRAAAQVERQVDEATGGLRNHETGMLLPSAIPLRLDPEVEWARAGDQPCTLLVLTTYGRAPGQSARRLVSSLRAHELAFELRYNEFLVGLWDTDGMPALQAARRLGAVLAQDAWEVTVGVATLGEDGTTSDELLTAARAAQVPLREVEAAAGTQPASASLLHRMRSLRRSSPVARVAAAARGRAVPLALATAALVAAYPLLAAADLGPSESGSVLLSLAFMALVTAAAWATTSMLEAGSTPLLLTGIGATAAATWIPWDAVAYPARVVAAGVLGLAAVRALERLDVIAPVLLLAGALDVWSVTSSEGTTRQLVEDQGAIYDLGAIHAPLLGGEPILVMGMLDVAVAGLLLGMARFWNLPPWRTALAVVAGLWLPLTVAPSYLTLPMIPSMAACFLLVHASPLLLEPLRTGLALARATR